MAKKNFLSILVTLFLFKCGFATADQMKEPNIIIINDQLSVYTEVAEKIILNANVNHKIVKRNDYKVWIEAKGDNDLLTKIIKLYNNAEKSGWVFGECEDGIPGKNLGIDVDKKKNLIKDVVLCSI